MDKLVIPNFRSHEMGQIIVTITVTNRIDRVLSERGFISSTEIRSCTLTDVLVDTGATLLCLPSTIINQLGLVQGGKASIETTAGIQQGRIFRDVELSFGDRLGTFDVEAAHTRVFKT